MKEIKNDASDGCVSRKDPRRCLKVPGSSESRACLEMPRLIGEGDYMRCHGDISNAALYALRRNGGNIGHHNPRMPIERGVSGPCTRERCCICAKNPHRADPASLAHIPARADSLM